jgi:hypothetical protein
MRTTKTQTFSHQTHNKTNPISLSISISLSLSLIHTHTQNHRTGWVL